MTVVSTEEAAARLDVTPNVLRVWVSRGYVQRPAPGMVDLDQAAEVRHRLASAARRRRLAELAQQLERHAEAG